MSDRYTVARIIRNGERFEILVKPQEALNYTMGKHKKVSEVLVTDSIFADARKGTKIGEEKLNAAFKTTDPMRVAEIILGKGELQLTTDQRRQLTSEKRRQIIDFIARQAVDPRTNLPHPPLRIEQAMEQVHYPINPFKDAEEQAKEIIKLLRPILPLKIEQVQIEVRIPPEHAARAYGTVKDYGQIKHEEWRGDGAWFCRLELPAGLYGPLLDKLGQLTKGSAEVKKI